MKINENIKIGIIGLGYVGLPLAVEFGRLYDTIGFDIDGKRVSELRNGYDKTLEIDDELLSSIEKLEFTTDLEVLREANIFIVTVPTPIDAYQQPDLTPLKKASSLIGSIIKKDDIVVYESTVFPGATEDECIPVVEEVSGLKFNVDFFAGYSPERINPGDKTRPVTKIVKVTSGSTPEVAEFVPTANSFWQSIYFHVIYLMFKSFTN